MLKYFDDVQVEYPLNSGKRIDFLIKLPDTQIPVEVKRYAKRIIKRDIPLNIIDQMNSIMDELGNNESIIIILTPGFGDIPLEMFNEFNRVNPDKKIHLIRGTKVNTLRNKLIKFLNKL